MGEYASGKSEVAVNRAVRLEETGHQVSLVDLDLVEPCYTLRPIKKELSAKGIYVIAWETGETIGLGETGNLIKPEARWALHRPGDIILDIGYGVEGAKTLHLLEGAEADPDLKVYAVLNISRPMTSSRPEIIDYVASLGPVHGLINNTHMGDETTVEIVQKGAMVVTESAGELAIPVVATTAVREIAGTIGEHDCMGNPVRPLDRYMLHSFW